MIKRALREICEGKTIAEIAEDLGMEYSALIAMLEHLVKMGYLIKGKKENTGPCASCPLQNVCSRRNYTVYFLTDKGKKLVNVNSC